MVGFGDGICFVVTVDAVVVIVVVAAVVVVGGSDVEECNGVEDDNDNGVEEDNGVEDANRRAGNGGAGGGKVVVVVVDSVVVVVVAAVVVAVGIVDVAGSDEVNVALSFVLSCSYRIAAALAIAFCSLATTASLCALIALLFPHINIGIYNES